MHQTTQKSHSATLNQGWLGRLTAALTLISLGLAIVGDVLCVADLSVVRTFDLATGTPLRAIAIPDTTCLNDLVASLEAPAADRGYDEVRNRLLMPLLQANQVVIQPLPERV